MTTDAQRQFPCEQCGAVQSYEPGTEVLLCAYCAHATPIPVGEARIREYPLKEALERLAHAPPAAERAVTQCESCAAEFGFETHVHAGECPFCGTPIVAATGRQRLITPKSLLPFGIDEAQARQAFRDWISKLWFAPGALRAHARRDSRLSGVYVPFWTYDSQTQSSYRGARGDVYYVTVPHTTTVKGRRVTRMRREQRVRWTPVSGTVSRYFDDVLVGASKSLPRQITQRLAPWDLDALIPYDERFLSGFSSEVFQVGLDQGFQHAIVQMDRIIRADVARDIGGDRQRVHDVDTRHFRTTFKHILLPIWSAAFRYRDKAYRFVVNGRTGKVQGERPYSVWKIAAAAIAGLALAAIAFVVLRESGY